MNHDRSRRALAARLLAVALGAASLASAPTPHEEQTVPIEVPPNTALAELEAHLENFWSNLEPAPAEAAVDLARAEDLAVELWLPADHPLMDRLSFAMTTWYQRDEPWLRLRPADRRSPGVIYETARRLRHPVSRSILFRRAWHLLDRNLRDPWIASETAYKAANYALHFGHADEARQIVDAALAATLPEYSREHAVLGLRFLDGKLLAEEGSQEAWPRLERVYRDVRPLARGNTGPNYHGWQLIASAELVGLAMRTCDRERLTSALQWAAEAERDLLIDRPLGLNDNLLRAMFDDLPQHAEIAAPLLVCGGLGEHVADLTLDRILLRRDAWRLRQVVLEALAKHDDHQLERMYRSLVSARRLQAQIQLRVSDEALRRELENLEIHEMLGIPEHVDLVDRAWFQLSAAAATLESNIVEAAHKDWKQTHDISPLKAIAKIRHALPGSAALIVYVELPPTAKDAGSVLAFVVDRASGVRWRHLEGAFETGPLSATRSWVRSVRPVGTDRSAGDPLRAAGRALIDPIEEFLAKKTDLSILADGALRRLPWHALTDRHDRYLGDRVSLRHLQAASDLYRHARSDVGRQEVVVLGPVYETLGPSDLRIPLSSRRIPTQFEPLPSAMEEVEAVASLLRRAGAEVNLLSADEATESAMWQLRRPWLLHFAGHGFRLESQEVSFQGEVSALGAPNFRWPFTSLGLERNAPFLVGIAFSDANRGGYVH